MIYFRQGTTFQTEYGQTMYTPVSGTYYQTASGTQVRLFHKKIVNYSHCNEKIFWKIFCCILLSLDYYEENCSMMERKKTYFIKNYIINMPVCN